MVGANSAASMDASEVGRTVFPPDGPAQDAPEAHTKSTAVPPPDSTRRFARATAPHSTVSSDLHTRRTASEVASTAWVPDIARRMRCARALGAQRRPAARRPRPRHPGTLPVPHATPESENYKLQVREVSTILLRWLVRTIYLVLSKSVEYENCRTSAIGCDKRRSRRTYIPALSRP